MYEPRKPTPLQDVIITCLGDVMNQRAKEIGRSPSRNFHLLPFARLVELTHGERQELLPGHQEITIQDCVTATTFIKVNSDPPRVLTFDVEGDKWFHLMAEANTRKR